MTGALGKVDALPKKPPTPDGAFVVVSMAGTGHVGKQYEAAYSIAKFMQNQIPVELQLRRITLHQRISTEFNIGREVGNVVIVIELAKGLTEIKRSWDVLGQLRQLNIKGYVGLFKPEEFY